MSSKLELPRGSLEDSSEVTDGFLGYPNRLNLTFLVLIQFSIFHKFESNIHTKSILTFPNVIMLNIGKMCPLL